MTHGICTCSCFHVIHLIFARCVTFVYAYIPPSQVLYVVGHPGAAEKGDMMDDVLYVKVRAG